MSMQKGKHQTGQQSQGYAQPRFANPQSHATYQRPQSQRPDVGFHVAAAGFAGPQPGGPNGPPGGIPNMPRGIHHPGHHGAPPGPGNPSLPPQGSSGGPGQQGGQQGGQQSQNQGPQGPTPTSTPPGDMGKQPPQHLQQQQQPQTQMPPGVIYSVGVGNQPRPPNAQTYYRGQGGPAPRLGNHRNQIVNIQPAHVGQPMFPHQVQMQSLPQMYQSQVVPQMQQPMFVTQHQMPMYGGQPRHQNHAGTGYFAQPTHQPILMAQHPLYPAGYPQQHAPSQQPFYYQTATPVSMQRPGGGVPGGQLPQMAQPPVQQVVQGGPPAQQMGQPTVPMTMVSGGSPQVAQSSVAPQGVPPASNRASSSGGRRKFALDIVDPKTMKSINSEIYEAGGGPGAAQNSAANSPPGSEDSSARQTPQPTQGSDSSAMDVVADFAARVAKVASEDSSSHPFPTTFSEGSSPSPSRELVTGNPSEPANSIQELTEESSKPIVVVEENQWKSLPKNTSSKSELTKDNESLTKLDNADHHNIAKLPDVERVFPKEFVPQSVVFPKVEVSRETLVESKPVPIVIKKETSLLENNSTPVVSANADTPAITLVHKNKTTDNPSLKSSNQVNQSPRKKLTLKEAVAPSPVVETKVSAAEKSSVLQTTVQLVPNVALVTSQEAKPPKKEEFAAPQAPGKDRGNAKKDKSVRGRPEKSSLSRDRADKNSRGSTERKTSGSRERETLNRKNSSSLSREREAADKRDKTPRPRDVAKPKKETETPEREVASTPPPTSTVVTVTEEMKQANGEVDAADGKVPKQHQQNAKAVKKGKMRDRKPGTDKELSETEVVSVVEAEIVAPAPLAAVVEPVIALPPVEPVLPETLPSAPSPVPKEEEEEVDEEQMEREESDKMVLARNEENAKVTAAALAEGAPDVIENVPATEPKVPPPFRKTLSYRDDQWSPVNLEGKKKYDRDFLMELKEDPQSKKKPDNLPDMEVVLKDNANNRQQPRGMADQRPMANRNQGAEAFTPNFMRTGGSNSRGPVTKRNSQQGKPVNKSGKPNVIHMSLSLREDVKLHETENAWKPDVMKRTTGGVVAAVEDDPTEELYRSVRGVLNKLTPQKFDTLVSQVQALPIDNKDKLNGVINLVFLKAVDEPGFSVAYAQMCKVLSDMQVPAERKAPNDPPHVNFRKLIVNRCQSEFEKSNEAELDKEARLKEIDLEDDPEKKKELTIAFEEEERRIRMKSVGNIRFIGELFKLKMLTTNIMHRCISHLLSAGDEESLECLCKLLTTIGKDLESKGGPNQSEVTQCFNKMKEIAGRRGAGMVSSRVRFMLQDVIELRQSKWVPRRDDANPKTMDQIQKEAERETMDMQIALSQPQTPRRQDDRGSMNDRRGGGKNMRGDSNQQMVDGWTNVPARTNRNLVVDSSKMKNIKGQTEIDNNMSLGSGSQFKNWARGAGGAVKSEEKKPSAHNNNNNLYNVLQETDYNSSQGGMTAPSASIEKERMLNSYKNFTADSSAAHSSRSSSLQQTSRPSSRDSSSRRAGGGGSTSMGSQPSSVSASTEDISRPTADKPKCSELTEDDVLKWATLIVGELLTSNVLPDCAQTVQEMFPAAQMHMFVCECLNLMLEKSALNRLSVGKFMVYLLQSSILMKEHYLEGLKEFLGTADDIEIDVPKIWLYLAETIVPLITSELLSFAEFRDSVRIVVKGTQIVVEALNLLFKEVGPNWIQERWEKSGLAWTDFMEPGLVDEFVKSHKLEYTVGGSSTRPTSGSSAPSMEEIRQKVVTFLGADSTSSASSFDQVCDWISANVGDRVEDPMFIRALMTAICESAISRNDPNAPWRLKDGVLDRHHALLQKYVDNKEPYELQCLYAIQALINTLEHPQGLCCSIFQELLDNNILSTEAFLSWKDCVNPAEQVGKGVALKSLTSFYTALQESISSGDEES